MREELIDRTAIDFTYNDHASDQIDQKIDVLDKVIMPALRNRYIDYLTMRENNLEKMKATGTIIIDRMYRRYAPLLSMGGFTDPAIFLIHRLVCDNLPEEEETETAATPAPAEAPAEAPQLVQV